MTDTSVHQFNPDMAPDSAFVPGDLKYLVVGNRGRWLDPRRTPFQILTLVPQTGHFILQVEAFEDKGARLEIPFEQLASYQLEVGSTEALLEDVARFAEIVARLNRPLIVPCDPESTHSTLEKLTEVQRETGAWLVEHSQFLKQHRQLDTESKRGPRELMHDLQGFMDQHGLLELEEAFATGYVSNPRSELIKGHRLVLAELGLVPYDGTLVRDPDLFDGQWTKTRRSDHILSRLSFMRALFAHVGRADVTLYRGLVFDGRPNRLRNNTFVSASFDFEVARSCFAARETRRTGLLIRQVVPIERVFMTYLETAQMNRQFVEAEAVVLHEPGNPLF